MEQVADRRPLQRVQPAIHESESAHRDRGMIRSWPIRVIFTITRGAGVVSVWMETGLQNLLHDKEFIDKSSWRKFRQPDTVFTGQWTRAGDHVERHQVAER